MKIVFQIIIEWMPLLPGKMQTKEENGKGAGTSPFIICMGEKIHSPMNLEKYITMISDMIEMKMDLLCPPSKAS
jgi:hypothetical protein